MLTVPPTDTTLTLHLKNNLPEPVSLVIPGQIATMTGVLQRRPGRRRARSFTAEAAATRRGDLHWTNFRPGTYLYQSGSHAAVQVQMGLFGGVKKEAAAGQAYTGSLMTTSDPLPKRIDPRCTLRCRRHFWPRAAMTSTVDYARSTSRQRAGEYTMTGVVPSIAVGSRVLVSLSTPGF